MCNRHCNTRGAGTVTRQRRPGRAMQHSVTSTDYITISVNTHYAAHTPSIAFRHLPPKEGCRKPVLGVIVCKPLSPAQIHNYLCKYTQCSLLSPAQIQNYLCKYTLYSPLSPAQIQNYLCKYTLCSPLSPAQIQNYLCKYTLCSPLSPAQIQNYFCKYTLCSPLSPAQIQNYLCKYTLCSPLSPAQIQNYLCKYTLCSPLSPAQIHIYVNTHYLSCSKVAGDVFVFVISFSENYICRFNRYKIRQVEHVSPNWGRRSDNQYWTNAFFVRCVEYRALTSPVSNSGQLRDHAQHWGLQKQPQTDRVGLDASSLHATVVKAAVWRWAVHSAVAVRRCPLWR